MPHFRPEASLVGSLLVKSRFGELGFERMLRIPSTVLKPETPSQSRQSVPNLY